jgi:hypothetical protein
VTVSSSIVVVGAVVSGTPSVETGAESVTGAVDAPLAVPVPTVASFEVLAESVAPEGVVMADDLVASLPLAATGKPPPLPQPVAATAITIAVVAASRHPRSTLARTMPV